MAENVPDGLKTRGAALWVALGQDMATGAGQIALEACRMADRLDEVDNVIQGKGVLELMRFRVLSQYEDDDGQNLNIRVEFSQVLAEARQQQATFKQLIETLGAHKAVAPPTTEVRSALDDLAQRRASRGSAPEVRGSSGVRQ